MEHNLIEFSEFAEFWESDKSVKYELWSVWETCPLYLCLVGCVMISLSPTPHVAGSNNLFYKKISHWIHWMFNEKANCCIIKRHNRHWLYKYLLWHSERIIQLWCVWLSVLKRFRVYPQWAAVAASASVAAANGGLWWRLKIGPRSIPSITIDQHWPLPLTLGVFTALELWFGMKISSRSYRNNLPVECG